MAARIHYITGAFITAGMIALVLFFLFYKEKHIDPLSAEAIKKTSVR